MSSLVERTVRGLGENGFKVVEVQTAAQAREYLLGAIAAGASVGVGGSVSVRETGVLPELEKKGCTVFSHWGVPAEEVVNVQRSARAADVYLCSANAVTADGRLVLLDGRGNRVGAVCDGPKNVYFIISKDKIVDGGLTAAIARVKSDAAPPNCKRLGLNTPCVSSGVCGGNACTDPSCRVTVILDYVPRGRSMTVILVDEKLGF